MNDLEAQISTTLQAKADASGEFTGLERTALPRARGIRRRELAVTSVVGLAALAVLAPIGWKFLANGPGPAPVPDPGPAATKVVESPSVPRTPVRTAIDLAKLPKGPAPKVPWSADGVIHDGAKEVRLPDSMRDAVGLRTLGDGYLVMYSADELTLKYAWKGADGALKREFPGLPVMDAAGTRIAYADERVDGRTKLYVLDLRTGKTTDTSTTEFPRHRPVGFATDPEGQGSERILLADRGGEGGTSYGTGQWNPADGTVESFDHDTVSRVARNTFVGTDRSGTSSCSGLYDLHGQELWKDCELATPDLTADGRYAYGSNGDRDRSRLLVRVAESGKIAYDISGAYTEPSGNFASEPDGSIVFRAEDAATGEQAALVRCRPTGRCELASELTGTGTPVLSD